MDFKKPFIFGLIIVFVLILIQNVGNVVFQFLFWQVSMSKVILAPLLMLIGGLIGFFIGRKSWDW